MKQAPWVFVAIVILCAGFGVRLYAAGETPPARQSSQETTAQMGKMALEGKAFIPPSWSAKAYENIWKSWGGYSEKPKDFDQLAFDRYGLHPAPYPNDGLPMGLRKASLLFQGLAVDCMICHGGSILGKSYLGLGNSSLDIENLFADLSRTDGRNVGFPFHFCNVKGTSEAGAMAVYLLGLRNPDLSLRSERLKFDLKDDLCEDVPAWWILKKKATMYYDGGANARSVRSKMQFMMSPLVPPSGFEKAEADFQRIQEYLLKIEAPKYPFVIDTSLAANGAKLFRENCSRCHGTYGETPTYPNKIVPIDEIGTDRKRFDGLSKAFGDYYNSTWFAQEESGWFVDGYKARQTAGYQAPPLDGIWATAPYFHNGSVPTLEGVLNSEKRPQRYTRSFRTGEDDYDKSAIGWKYQSAPPANPKDPPYIQRRIYDTTQPGRGNQGHTYGDHLTDAERKALIEYLKTL